VSWPNDRAWTPGLRQPTLRSTNCSALPSRSPGPVEIRAFKAAVLRAPARRRISLPSRQGNDHFAHAVRDEILRALAGIFRANTHEIDVVGCYSGEKFVIAFPETQADEAVDLAERTRVTIKEHAWTDVHPELSVTISMSPSADVGLGSFEKVLGAADRELYQAKKVGRDRVCY
jgi:diguanylate cyclase (GGDEF)-like protein